MKFLLTAIYFACLANICLQTCFIGVDGVPLNFNTTSSVWDQETDNIFKLPGEKNDKTGQVNWMPEDKTDLFAPLPTVGSYEYVPAPETTGYTYHHSFIIIPVGLILFLIRICVRAARSKNNGNSDREPIVT